VIFLSASRFSASARITCQFCCNGASSAKSVTGMKGVLDTFEKDVHEDVDGRHQRRMIQQLASERQANLAAKMIVQD
jgi:hypothetical protein